MTDNSSFPDPPRLDRYLAGEATPDELRAMLNAARDTDLDAHLRALRAGVVQPAGELPPFDVPVRAAAIVERSLRLARRQRMQPPVSDGNRREPSIGIVSRVVRRHAALLASVGAAAAVLVAVGFWWHGTTTSPTTDAAVLAKVYRTANAQRATITLPDGSTAVLGPSSVLTVAAEFGVARRKVTIEGQGYFDVRTDAAHPFLVRAGAADVRVLGTSFAVRHYPSDRVSRVVVTAGRVALTTSAATRRGEAILSAGMLGVADSGTVVVTSHVATGEYTDWTTGRLVFHDTPLRDVLADVERQYDLTLRFADTTLLHKTFNAQFGDEPASQVLDAIALAFHAQYTRSGPNGRVVAFTPSRRPIPRGTPANRRSSSAQESHYGR